MSDARVAWLVRIQDRHKYSDSQGKNGVATLDLVAPPEGYVALPLLLNLT